MYDCNDCIPCNSYVFNAAIVTVHRLHNGCILTILCNLLTFLNNQLAMILPTPQRRNTRSKQTMTNLSDISKHELQEIIWHVEALYEIFHDEDMADETRSDFRDYTKDLKSTCKVLNHLFKQVEENEKRELFREKVREANL